MTLKLVIRLTAWILALAGAAEAGAAELPIITKARAYAGTEAALNALHAVHFYGTLVTNDPKDATKQTRAAIEIVMQKPARQRVSIVSNAAIETTALDGYEAWTRVTAADDGAKWQQTLLGADGIRRLRANTWENLSFYRGIEGEGGRIEDKGTTTLDGAQCHKVAFVHAPNIIFTRYFDLRTGRVLLTETESGTIREQGELVASGIRFPKSITQVSKNPAGQDQTVTITFERIEINQPKPADYFSVPPLKSR